MSSSQPGDINHVQAKDSEATLGAEEPSFVDVSDVENRPSAGVRHWRQAVLLQLERATNANKESREIRLSRHQRLKDAESQQDDQVARTRLHVDVNFLVIAIRNVLRFHEAIAKVLTDARLGAARTKFNEAVPNAVDLRNLYEHLDAYVLGTGKEARFGRVSPVLRRTTYDDSVTICIGELRLEVTKAAAAAVELASVTELVWEEAIDRLRPSIDLPPDDGKVRYLKAHISVSDILEDTDGTEYTDGVLQRVEISDDP